MTVCVGIKVHDCIVFAADSASSQIGPLGIENVWNHGIKVFNLHKDLPIVAMTAGMGNFGNASISNLTKDLRIELMDNSNNFSLDPTNYKIGEVAEIANKFFGQKYEELSHQHSFNFWIGGYGYGADNDGGEIWELGFQDGRIHEPVQLVSSDIEGQLLWGGQSEAISRLVNGVNRSALLQALRRKGLTEDDALDVVNDVMVNTAVSLVHAIMPIQDAINLADFLVDLTKKYSAFMLGSNVVGGETDIATVTKHEGFKWIRRKHYYPPELNPKETDHAEQKHRNS